MHEVLFHGKLTARVTCCLLSDCFLRVFQASPGSEPACKHRHVALFACLAPVFQCLVAVLKDEVAGIDTTAITVALGGPRVFMLTLVHFFELV